MSGTGYTRVRDLIMARFSVSDTSAEGDLASAYAQIASDAERDRPILRARENVRMNRIALAAERGRDFGAAISASARLAKINGLDAAVPDLGVTHDESSMLRAIQLDPSTMTRAEARAHIHVLSLTPAQRLAEKDRLAGEEAALLDELQTEDTDDE